MRSVSSQMRALNTTGDGACGMHALFGQPKLTLGPNCSYFQLYVSDPRELAVHHLGPSLEDLEERIDAEGQASMRDIKTQLWGIFAITSTKIPKSRARSFGSAYVLRIRTSLKKRGLRSRITSILQQFSKQLKTKHCKQVDAFLHVAWSR